MFNNTGIPEINKYRKGEEINMSEEKIQSIIDQSIERKNCQKHYEKQKYLMSFGDFSIQYDFTLN